MAPTPSIDADTLARYRERCLQETRALDEAEIRFRDVVRLDDGERTRFEVSLVPPGALPSASGGLAQGRLQLACAVEARLTSPSGGVTIAPDEWVGDQYLPPAPTSWTWLVTATDPGRADALLQLRPAILVGEAGSAPAHATLGTVDFTVTFDVERNLAETAGQAWAWVVGLVGFIAVALGIPITYRTLRGQVRPAATGGEGGRPVGPRAVSRARGAGRPARAPLAPGPAPAPSGPSRSSTQPDPVRDGKASGPPNGSGVS